MREIFIDLESDLRIRFTRSEPPPPVIYAITLEAERDGVWHTIRLWDNAHDSDEHHEHPYTRTDGKQPPTILPYTTINQAMAEAIKEARLKGHEILAQWEKTP